ncbi:MAG TPA: peptidylprolyl isomerase [Burkholderiaceae bacterium]|nr:peptidylprolyl isomerase [Burkholderiaceae bacterium]
MKITAGTLVSLDVKMYDAQDNLLEASTDPLVYLHGANDIFPVIERALEGQEAGFETSLQLEPHDAFGEDDPALLHLVQRSSLGAHVAIGMKVEGVPGKAKDGRIYTVTDLTDTIAVLDGNHPLAGRALRFSIKVRAVEKASEDELEQAESAVAPDFLRPVARQDIHGGDDHKH